MTSTQHLEKITTLKSNKEAQDLFYTQLKSQLTQHKPTQKNIKTTLSEIDHLKS